MNLLAELKRRKLRSANTVDMRSHVLDAAAVLDQAQR